MILPKKIRIREVGPREGFQILPQLYKTSQKAKLIELLANSGLTEIEVTSFVRKDKVPQMADAEELVSKINTNQSIRYTALYLNPEGFKRAEICKGLNNDCWINAACSETFLAKNSNTSIDKILQSIPLWLNTFSQFNKKLHGLLLSTAFGCNYQGNVPSDKVTEILSKFMNEFAKQNCEIKELTLADTVGMGTPASIEEVVLKIRKAYPDLYISLHLHNTNGLGMANVLSGLQQGVDCFDSSIGGIGGCPFSPGSSGNISTEDLVFMCNKIGIETGVNIEMLVRACEYLENELGIKLNSEYRYTKI